MGVTNSVAEPVARQYTKFHFFSGDEMCKFLQQFGTKRRETLVGTPNVEFDLTLNVEFDAVLR